MKSKIFNRLAISLATSVLVLSTPKVFAQNVEWERQKEPQPLEFDLGNISGNAHNQDIIRQNKAIDVAATTTSQTTQFSKSSLTASTDKVSDPLGGFFVTFVFIVYILLGLQYRRHRTQRTVLLLQQIETLERIWNMQSHR
jgi:hypothetical protein